MKINHLPGWFKAAVCIFVLLDIAIWQAGGSEDVIGHGAKGTINVVANNGTDTDKQDAAGSVDANTHLSKEAKKAPATASGEVLVWNHVKGTINAQPVAAAKATPKCTSNNSVTSTAELKLKEARKSTIAIVTKLKATIHSAKPVTVKVTVTTSPAGGGGPLDKTEVTYTLNEDASDNTKVEMTDGKNSKNPKQGAEVTYENEGKQFTFPLPVSPTKYDLALSVDILGEADGQAEVSADVSFKVK